MSQELTNEEKMRAMDLQVFREAERKKKKEAIGIAAIGAQVKKGASV